MTNGIAQFNMQFDAVEDRIQLRVLSTNDEEIRLWLTRRYVRLLLKALSEKFNLPSLKPSQSPQSSQTALAANEHSSAASGSSSNAAAEGSVSERFSDPYLGTEETSLPMGESPILVSRIALKEKDDGNFGLLLGQKLEGGMQVELSLSRELIDNLQAMLVEAAHTAEWGISELPVAEAFTEHLSGVVLH